MNRISENKSSSKILESAWVGVQEQEMLRFMEKTYGELSEPEKNCAIFASLFLKAGMFACHWTDHQKSGLSYWNWIRFMLINYLKSLIQLKIYPGARSSVNQMRKNLWS